MTKLNIHALLSHRGIILDINPSLHKIIKKISIEEDTTVRNTMQSLLWDGLDLFDKRLMTISPSVLLADYNEQFNKYEREENKSYVILNDRHLVMKTRLRAGEYECSLSFLINCLVDKALMHYFENEYYSLYLLSSANDNEGGDGVRADTTKDSWWIY